MPVSSWRSVGASGNGFLHESALDELIHAAGADPLAERLRLCSHEPSKRVLQAVGEMSGWNTPLAPSPDGAKRGRGLAFTLSFGVPVAEVVEVTATDQGIRIDKVFVVCEVGKVLDPVNFEGQVQGGVIWGLGHAINCELMYADGVPQQTNFHAYHRPAPEPDAADRGEGAGDHRRDQGHRRAQRAARGAGAGECHLCGHRAAHPGVAVEQSGGVCLIGVAKHVDCAYTHQ